MDLKMKTDLTKQGELEIGKEMKMEADLNEVTGFFSQFKVVRGLSNSFEVILVFRIFCIAWYIGHALFSWIFLSSPLQIYIKGNSPRSSCSLLHSGDLLFLILDILHSYILACQI